MPGALDGRRPVRRPLFTPARSCRRASTTAASGWSPWLAEQTPLVLAVDDAHWADAASLRVLLDVQAELSVLPVLLVLASRPVENPDVTAPAGRDGRPAGLCRAHPRAAQSRKAVEAVVDRHLGEPAHDAFVDECLTVSGGNAFYLHELLRPYRGDFRLDLQSMRLRRHDVAAPDDRRGGWASSAPSAAILAQAAAVPRRRLLTVGGGRAGRARRGHQCPRDRPARGGQHADRTAIPSSSCTPSSGPRSRRR